MYLKEVYFCNAMCDLNQTWVFYRGGIAVAMLKS